MTITKTAILKACSIKNMIIYLHLLLRTFRLGNCSTISSSDKNTALYIIFFLKSITCRIAKHNLNNNAKTAKQGIDTDIIKSIASN